MSELRYRKDVYPSGPNPVRPGPGECGIWRPLGDTGPWYLSFGFTRTTDGKSESRSIPVNVNGPPINEHNAWGLKRTDVPGRWQINPSIQCCDGNRDDLEVWHETPAIVDVPEGEPWQ